MATTGPQPPLFTIGYEQTPSAAVLGRLEEAGIDLLVDVRAVAASRRPGFSKRQLAAGLQEHGIGYLHLRALGTPKEGRLAARAGRLGDLAHIFEAHLTTDAARADLDELASLARSKRRLCLLCYERDPAHCHRSMIADEIAHRTGVPIEHLFCAPV